LDRKGTCRPSDDLNEEPHMHFGIFDLIQAKQKPGHE
jgi:hypothetical protein